jgi:hypothetical protein
MTQARPEQHFLDSGHARLVPLSICQKQQASFGGNFVPPLKTMIFEKIQPKVV